MKQPFKFTAPVILALSLCFSAAPKAVQSSTTEPERVLPTVVDIDELNVTATRQLQQLTQQRPLRIDGAANTLILGWGSRFDQLPQSANLMLHYRFSPNLLAGASQVNILLNNETVHSINLNADEAGQNHQQRIALPTALLTDYNQLQFELIAKSAAAFCPAPDASTWFELTAKSALEMTYQRLPLANELGYFPEPFYYQQEFSGVNIPFYLPQQTSAPLLESAAILASYFASQAQWRELKTPTRRYAEQLAADGDWATPWRAEHSVVFMTNSHRPAAFRDLPEITQPKVKLIDNPKYPGMKVLLVMAPTSGQLKDVVNGLIVSADSLSGAEATFSQLTLPPRDAYEAPNWLSTRKPVRFSALINDASELQRSGRNQAPIQLPLRLPPDLLLWQQSSVPLDIDYRYSPPVTQDNSRLIVSVNNEFVKAYPLTSDGVQDSIGRVTIPLLEASLFGPERLRLPAFKLAVVNQLAFDFKFSQTGSNCNFIPADSTRAAIDSTSTIDLTGFDHYTAMPNLRLFAKAGYPFTRYDDLSKTTILMPENPNDELIDLLLTNVALFSASTGYPAHQVQIQHSPEAIERARQDILILGPAAATAWLDQYGDEGLRAQLAPHRLAGKEALFSKPGWVMKNSGETAAVVSFKSPLSSTGTVVMQTATSNDMLTQLRQQLSGSESSDQFRGFMTLSTPGGLSSYDATQLHYVGTLTYWSRIKYHAAQHPVLIVLLSVFAILVLALSVYRLLRHKAARRQQGGH